MKFSILSVTWLGLTAASNAFIFQPDTSNQVVDTRLPILYSITESQTLTSNTTGTSSFWTSSHVTGNNSRQYLIISHILVLVTTRTGFYCASILDLTSMDKYTSYVAYANLTATQLSDFNLVTSNYGFSAVSPDKVSIMRTWSDYAGVTFNITFEATTHALFNGGTGALMYGSDTNDEWALPACRTAGSLTLDGESVTIIPEHSVTWYDRQWGLGAPTTGNWTWFEFHFDGTDTKASMWMIDNAQPYQRTRFATMRLQNRDMKVIPVSYEPNMNMTWTSDATGIVYPLEWMIDMADDGFLAVQSPVADQEMVGSSMGDTAYEGFVTVFGILRGMYVTGYGVVEMITAF
ncbi:hypothetical protein BO71DRAFT_120178 [Aspergillus ellipticus CBS 707.79]|uniref:AttH domain-containing protein n=1 Tax=Aspergillus ellipticus CBS 707.79 TaxID=1448320 RepID=A0A319DLK6_9EURO|nr:hypothetical protein BO71DRAFT_120178 [Aspergillus ellipticus CBS 707.79]